MNKYILVISTFFLSLECFAQHTVIFQPGPCDGKSAYLGSYQPNENFGGDQELDAFAWTCDDNVCIARTVFQFDLSAMPPGTAITSALLSLWYNSTTTGNPLPEDDSNEFHIYAVSEPWGLYTVTWNNQPTYDTANAYAGQASTSTTQNYLNMDVTAMVRRMVDSPSLNYGFLIKLDTEVIYRAHVFCSSFYMNYPNMRPELTITYLGDSILPDTATSGCSATISANKLTLCEGDSAQLCATGCFTSCMWNTGDTATCITTPLAGNYYVTASDNGTCSAVSNHIHISVYEPTPVTISVSGDTLSGYGYNSYQWYFDGNPINGANAQTYIAPAPGTYTLQITDSNGCTYMSIPVVIAGINGILGNYPINIYPNPTTSTINIQLQGGTGMDEFKLYNTLGQQVVAEKVNQDKLLSIDVAQLPKGVYLVKVTDKSGKAFYGKEIVD